MRRWKKWSLIFIAFAVFALSCAPSRRYSRSVSKVLTAQSEKPLEQLLAQLFSENRTERALAAAELKTRKLINERNIVQALRSTIQENEPTITDLIELLKSPDPEEQARAKRALELRGVDSLAPLLDALQASFSELRKTNPVALSEIKIEPEKKEVKQLDKKREPKKLVKQQVQEERASLQEKSKTIVSPVKTARSTLSWVRKTDNPVVVKLINRLRSPDRAKRVEAAAALQKHGDETIPILIRALKDSSSYVRVWVATVLGNLGAEEARPALEEAQRDVSHYVRRRAQVALEKIASRKRKVSISKTPPKKIEVSKKVRTAKKPVAFKAPKIEKKNVKEDTKTVDALIELAQSENDELRALANQTLDKLRIAKAESNVIVVRNARKPRDSELGTSNVIDAEAVSESAIVPAVVKDSPSQDSQESGLVNLPGTVWSGTDSLGDRYVFEFGEEGALHYTNPAGSKRQGIWRQNGTQIYFSMNGGYSEYLGTLIGNSIEGKAWNKQNLRWTWKIYKQ